MIISVKLHQLLSLPRCLLRFFLNLPNKVRRLIVLTPFLIKSLKRSGGDFLFLLRFFFLLLILLLLLLLQFLSIRVLSDHWTDSFEIYEYGRYGCEIVQQGLKIQNVGLKG